MATTEPNQEVASSMQRLLAQRQHELDDGAKSLGWKVGLNAPAIQAHFGITGPVVGYLSDRRALEPDRVVTIAGWHQPMAEVEVAIRIGDDGRIAGLGPALELVDLDLPFERIGPILEHNIFHRGVMFGPEAPGASVGELAVEVRRNGEVVARGNLEEAPERTVATVGAFLATHGAALGVGERIIAGSLTPPVAIAPGDRLEVSYGAFGAFSVSFS